MSPKKWSKNTFGWARAEVLGALVNAVFLVALCFSITVEACKRFIEPTEIHRAEILVIVGVVGLLVNLIGLLLFHGNKTNNYVKLLSQVFFVPRLDHGHSHKHSHETALSRSRNRLTQLAVTDDNENDETYPSPPPPPPPPTLPAGSSHHGHGHSHANVKAASNMNMRGVFLHVLSDALGSVIVIISALVYWQTSWKYRCYIDPALSIVLVVLILHSVWPLLRDSALILLQTVPTHIQVDAIQRRLLAKVDGVLAVHEFHVWQLAGDRIIASAHIRCVLTVRGRYRIGMKFMFLF